MTHQGFADMVLLLSKRKTQQEYLMYDITDLKVPCEVFL